MEKICIYVQFINNGSKTTTTQSKLELNNTKLV